MSSALSERPDEPKELRVRRARLDDYEAVMALNRNVFEGLDYLPSMYSMFLHDKSVHNFVVELDGKVVRIYI